MSRILVVTDAVETAEDLVMLFTAMGHDARTAVDGVRALEATGRFDPHIVFLDLALPNLDGYEAVSTLRAQARGAAPVLIALTESEGEAVNSAVKAAGFDTYMCKPVDTMALIAVVSEIARRG